MVVGESLLHNLQVLVGLLKLLFEALLRAGLQDALAADSDVDLLPPGGVHRLEPLGLLGELLHDVGGVKDGLEVHPLALTLDPFL